MNDFNQTSIARLISEGEQPKMRAQNASYLYAAGTSEETGQIGRFTVSTYPVVPDLHRHPGNAGCLSVCLRFKNPSLRQQLAVVWAGSGIRFAHQRLQIIKRLREQSTSLFTSIKTLATHQKEARKDGLRFSVMA